MISGKNELDNADTLIFDLDRCIISLSNLDKNCLWSPLLELIQPIATSIKAVIFCTHRYSAGHPQFLASAFNVLSAQNQIFKFDNFLTTSVVNNFLYATGLQNKPYVVSCPDDKSLGCGEAYKQYMESWEKEILKNGTHTYQIQNDYMFPEMSAKPQLFNSMGKNQQLRQSMAWAAEQKSKINNFIYFDDKLSLGLYAIHSNYNIPSNNKVNLCFFHVDQKRRDIEYIPRFFEPISTTLPLIESTHDQYTRQVMRLLPKSIGKTSQADIHPLIIELSAKLRADKVALPDHLIKPFIKTRMEKKCGCFFTRTNTLFFNQSGFMANLAKEYLRLNSYDSIWENPYKI